MVRSNNFVFVLKVGILTDSDEQCYSCKKSVVVGKDHHSGIKTTSKLLKPRYSRAQKCKIDTFLTVRMYYRFLPKLELFTLMPTCIQHVLALNTADQYFQDIQLTK